jgi:diguanylate cyclase (GGDEF)-like protein
VTQLQPELTVVITLAITLIGAFFRFYCTPLINKWLLCAAAFILLTVLNQSELGDFFPFICGIFVLLVSYSFSWYGALGSVLLVSALTPYGSHLYFYALFGYVLTGLVGIVLQLQSQRRLASDELWQAQLYKQSRHYSILKEISIAIQSTLELGNLLHIILTAITAGSGLGFNRALLFLFDDQGGRLKGELGIGSMSEHEGISIWNRVVNNRMILSDLIVQQEEAKVNDYKLNDLLREIEIPVQAADHIINRAIAAQKPYIVRSIEPSDPVQRMMSETFRMSSFAVVPMLNQGKAVGVIIVDNNINQKALDIEEVDSIIPLATQASIAIENSRLYERAQKLSITDNLTGLFNQRYFQETGYQLVTQAENKDLPLSLIMLDIDFFKRYNDTNGHLEGNNVLIALGQIIAAAVSEPHVPCRFGGEEFVVLLPHASSDHAQSIAEHIRSAVERHSFHNGQAQPDGKVTVSIGVAAYRPGMSVTQLLDAADKALYKAKREGKNRVIVQREGVASS